MVAPSRGRGSKRSSGVSCPVSPWSPLHGGVDRNANQVNIISCVCVAPSRGRGSKHHTTLDDGAKKKGRPFTGAWIETTETSRNSPPLGVAPSRGRGSKHTSGRGAMNGVQVAPSRGRGSKQPSRLAERACHRGRPFTGAWIETFWLTVRLPSRQVAPSRGRGSKLQPPERPAAGLWSPLHGGVDRNSMRLVTCPNWWSSPLHGGVDRNVCHVVVS